MNRGMAAIAAAGLTVLAIGCSSDKHDGRLGRDDRDGDYRSAREQRDRAQGDYADRDHDGIRDGIEDRNRDGVRDGDQNNGRRTKSELPDINR